jgi:hypothetical protein
MRDDWLLAAGSAAILVLAVATARGWLAPTSKPSQKMVDPIDPSDTRARARAILAYLTANRSGRSTAP